MKLNRPLAGILAEDLWGFPAHWVEEAWEEFTQKHSDWLGEIGCPDPLYCLPLKVIDSLAKPKRSNAQLMTSKAVAAERDLARLCHPAQAVGFAGGRFIFYPLLCDERAGNPPQQLRAPRVQLWPPAIANDSIRERLKGCAGRLITDLQFLTEVAALHDRWRDCPEARRPILPLSRTIYANDYPAGERVGSAEQEAFEADFRALCDKWVIAGLATWDLPVPRCPVLPGEDVPSEGAPVPGMLTLAVPFFYPLVGEDSLAEMIYQRQRQEARRLGLDVELAGLSHYKAYGELLTVAHIERVILERYGASKPRWGLAGSVEQALQALLGIGSYQVKKLRKAVSACRRGKRESVSWLRPRRR